MNRVEELRFGKQMDKSPDKKTLIGTIITHKCTRVLDLGAGTGLISKTIAAAGIKADAVDKCFKTDELINTEYLTYYPVDMFTFLKNTTNKYDCIVLSAILHELNPFQINKLKRLLKKVIDKDKCLILIREPFYEKTKEGIKPFKDIESQKKIKELVTNLTPENKLKKFFKTPKLSWRNVPKCIKYLNLVFTNSYGEQSWEREVKENRFAFSKNYLEKFCKSLIPNCDIFTTKIYDKSYAQIINNIGYTKEVVDSFEYSTCLLIAQIKSTK